MRRNDISPNHALVCYNTVLVSRPPIARNLSCWTANEPEPIPITDTPPCIRDIIYCKHTDVNKHTDANDSILEITER